ncbi:MAG: hypothetical protein BAJATHORv1_110025 [Candidatus Thorarchaeota archaeon]|nr:MAG: hypothetical protein BAJATHORv1_110025 [Candidatus Thorarchaeota archaeon]
MPKKIEASNFDSLAKKLETSIETSKEPLADGKVHDMREPSFMNLIRKIKTSVLIFYRSHCPFCERLLPILEDLAEEFALRVYFGKVNVDEVEGVQEEFNILGVPVVVAFKKGMMVSRVEGLRSREEYEYWIDSIHKGFRPMGLDVGEITKL